MKKYLYIFLSFYIVFFTTTNAYAASPAGWVVSPTDIIIGAAGNTVTAIKGAGSSALQSTVKYAPTAANIGKKLLRGGGTAALLLAVPQLIGDGVDWVLDPANNRVVYKTPDLTDALYKINERSYPDLQSACKYRYDLGLVLDPRATYAYVGSRVSGTNFYCDYTRNGVSAFYTGSIISGPNAVEKYLPISTVAAKVQSNAIAGHAPSQDLVKTVIIDDVDSGALDTQLNINAVPVADAPPINPPYDPTQPAPPFDPSSIIAAIKSVMSAVVNMAGILGAKIDVLMVEMGLQNAETQRVINEGMDKVVAANDRTGAKVGEVVAAIEALEGNTLDGKVINDAVDRAIAAGHTDTASIVAAIEAIEGNTLDGQVINDAVDRVIANDNANAQVANDVISQSADKALEADAVNTGAVTDAINESGVATQEAIANQTDQITNVDPETGERSLKMPGFCSWAAPVCSFIDWTKAQWLEFTLTFTALKDWLFEDAPADDKDNTIDTPVLPVTPVHVAINFVGSCPAPLTFEYKIYNQTFKPAVPFTPICEVAILINPVIKICATIAAIFIIAGIRQGNS